MAESARATVYLNPKVYRATNLRTGESWEAPDSQHSCGGA